MTSKRMQSHISEEPGLKIEMRAGGTKKHAEQEKYSLEDHSFLLVLILVQLQTGRMKGHAPKTMHRQSQIHLLFSPYSVSFSPYSVSFSPYSVSFSPTGKLNTVSYCMFCILARSMPSMKVYKKARLHNPNEIELNPNYVVLQL